MKIGIFGDSFADSNNGGDTKYRHQSWPYLLEERFSVNNYALSGTGLEYSLDKLFKHEHEYDKIIFVSTCPDRLAIHERHHNKLAYPCNKNAVLHQHIRPSDATPRLGDRFYNKALKLALRHHDTFVDWEHLDLRVDKLSRHLSNFAV